MSLLCFYKCIDFGLKTKMSITSYPIGLGVPRMNAVTPHRPPTKNYSGKDVERFWKSIGYWRLRSNELHFSLKLIQRNSTWKE